MRRRSRALGLTQSVLAERAGVHVRQIRRYESGEQQPVLAVAARLAAALDVTLDELAGVAGGPVVDGDWWAARQAAAQKLPLTAFSKQQGLIQWRTSHARA